MNEKLPPLPKPDFTRVIEQPYPFLDDFIPYFSAAQMEKYARLAAPVQVAPIDMVLHCPKCHMQHIDESDERTPGWKNEPHRSHLCHGCSHIWRPADVPTNGVAAVSTAGKADSPIAAADDARDAARKPMSDYDIARLNMAVGGDYAYLENVVRQVEDFHRLSTPAAKPAEPTRGEQSHD